MVRVGLVVIPHLPRSLLLVSSRFIGLATYLLATKLNRIGRANLDLAFGSDKTREEKNTILKESYRVFALAFLDGFWFSRHTTARTEQWFNFDETMRPILNDRAMLCVTAHLGNWEILGHAMAIHGQPMHSLSLIHI